MPIVTFDTFYEKGMNVLVYGDPGVGKTVFAASAQDVPQMKNVHFIDIEGGLLSVAERGDINATPGKTIGQIENLLARFQSRTDPEFKDVRTVVLDNITELQALDVQEFVNKKITPSGARTVDDVYIEDYGKSTKRMARVLRGFRELPLNVVFVAHKKEDHVKISANETRLSAVRPNLTAILNKTICGYMDFVWYMYMKEERFVQDGVTYTQSVPALQTRKITASGVTYEGKTRGIQFANNLGLEVVNPTFQHIFNVYNSTAATLMPQKSLGGNENE